MLVFSTQTMIQDGVITLHPLFQQGTYIHSNRVDLARMALQDHNADYLFWLDDDMRFPKDVLLQLLNRRQYIVGANYSTRGIPARFVAIKEIGKDNQDPGVKCETRPDSTGLEEVAAIGFGCVLIKREVFLKTEYPWFQNRWDAPRNRFVGEDVHFCLAAKEAGFPTFVDHDLSKQIGHEGSLEFRAEHAQTWKDIETEAQPPTEQEPARPVLYDATGDRIGGE